jgi:hypothetical protein
MSTMDLRVAQAITAARTLETAYHDPGPWTMVYGPVEMPAVRMIAADRIIFRAWFPEVCPITPADKIELRCRDRVLSVQECDEPAAGEFIDWVITASEPQIAPVG